MKRARTTALLQFDLLIDELDFPPNATALFEDADRELQCFWDDWSESPIEQYVACDYRYVWHALQSLLKQQVVANQRFVEWGCGFGIVTGLAAICGLRAVGIEAEPFLVERGRNLLARHRIDAELWEGNFLPDGAEEIADCQSDYASMFHSVTSAYRSNEVELGDFAIVFAYPWPGEEHFLREVFYRYAAIGTVLLLYRGPYQIEFYRKQRS